jgi:hypothetical protein
MPKKEEFEEASDSGSDLVRLEAQSIRPEPSADACAMTITIEDSASNAPKSEAEELYAHNGGAVG